ncbi:hypothetical protein F2Q70_00044590 [Brassica cretica]|uniref:HTH myb-type domain-containing protein n=1 Tax=Brassica cretica TaxID=69181 RepID=A0A8S9KN80_BRACR|nr:hypothetical protein F2Q70_00044590 [Brassica cretica]KAF2605939.1 hypothetical protein F2Q68_00045552 [Brassica cretica]
MPNRTDNDIKNHWNSCLKKRLVRSGIDPMTHQPVVNVKANSSSTTSSPTLTPSSSSTTSSFSSTSSSRLLNRLAAGISSRKQGFDRIKNVILSEPRQAVKEDALMISSKEEEEEVKGCFMEIDDNLISTTSLYELLSEPYDMYQSDFGLESDEREKETPEKTKCL